MILTHKICLQPIPAQEEYFRRASGVARFAYNWALSEWKRQYEAGEKPSEGKLHKQLNAVKAEQFPWMLEVTKVAPQQAIKNLGAAYRNFFDDLKKYRRGELRYDRIRRPDFKRKGGRDSFRAENGPDTFAFDGKRIRLPRVGWVKMREGLRFDGKPVSAVVSRTADRWFVSVAVEVDVPVTSRENQAVGIDLGIKALATLSDGTVIDGPKALRSNLKRLRRLSRSHSRKQKGSANRRKSAMKLARLHARIANIRMDSLHKLTSSVTERYGIIGIEDLNVRGMLANRCLSRAIADMGLFEFRRQLDYKAAMRGCEVVTAGRFWPSSKTCSTCGTVIDAMPLSVREWTCEDCGSVHERDLNAAVNLKNLAASYVASARGAGSNGSRRKPRVELPALKQERNCEHLCPQFESGSSAA